MLEFSKKTKRWRVCVRFIAIHAPCNQRGEPYATSARRHLFEITQPFQIMSIIHVIHNEYLVARFGKTFPAFEMPFWPPKVTWY